MSRGHRAYSTGGDLGQWGAGPWPWAEDIQVGRQRGPMWRSFENQTEVFGFYSVWDCCRLTLLFANAAGITDSFFLFANRATLSINFAFYRPKVFIKRFCRCLTRGMRLELISPLFAQTQREGGKWGGGRKTWDKKDKVEAVRRWSNRAHLKTF